AFDLYLKGRYYWNTRTPEGLRKSIEYFTRAVETDRHFAPSFAGLADAYTLGAFYHVQSAGDAFAQAEVAARQAIDLDPELAEAHAALAVLRVIQLRWHEAEASFRRAIDLNPSYASAHHWYALWHLERGDFDRARAEMRAAQSLDPFSNDI